MTKAIEAWVKRNQINFNNENEKNHLIEFLTHEYGHKNSINFSYSQCVVKAEAWVTKLNLKNLSQIDLGLVETVFEDGPYKVVKIMDQTARDYEGAQMSHCVATYKDQDELYSLRDKENIPHCTIQIERDRVRQISGRGNGPVSPKYVEFLVSFLQSRNLEICHHTISQIGYLSSPNSVPVLRALTSNVKIRIFNNREYIYKRNKLNFIKPLLNESEDTIHKVMTYLCQSENNREDLIELIKSHEKLLIKPEIVPAGYVLKITPIEYVLAHQDLEFAKLLFNNHIKDCSNLFSNAWRYHAEVYKYNEKTIIFLIDQGFRIDNTPLNKKKDEAEGSTVMSYSPDSHAFALRILTESKDPTVIEKFKKAGLDPTQIRLSSLWHSFSHVARENDPAKLEYFKSIKLSLDDNAIAILQSINAKTENRAGFNLFINSFGITVEDLIGRKSLNILSLKKIMAQSWW